MDIAFFKFSCWKAARQCRLFINGVGVLGRGFFRQEEDHSSTFYCVFLAVSDCPQLIIEEQNACGVSCKIWTHQQVPCLETCSLASGSVPCISREGICSRRFGMACVWLGGVVVVSCVVFCPFMPSIIFWEKLRKGRTDSVLTTEGFLVVVFNVTFIHGFLKELYSKRCTCSMPSTAFLQMLECIRHVWLRRVD